MQGSDGNLGLYQRDGTPLWSTGPAGAGASAIMQGDGNLVVYNGGAAMWNAQTAGHGGAFLVDQNDSNLVIYQGSTAIWTRSTGSIGGGGSDGRSAIVSIAESQDQYGARVANNPATTADAGCNPYTAYWGDGSTCANGLRANAWCADFVAWVWRQAGVSFTYGGGGSNINAWSASFYEWGVAHGTWHSISSGYRPQPGDAVVYGNLTEAPGPGHVGVYVSGSATSPTVVNGNWATSWPNPTNYGVIINANQSNTGVSGGVLQGYVSP
jgi:hypothetical protein